MGILGWYFGWDVLSLTSVGNVREIWEGFTGARSGMKRSPRTRTSLEDILTLRSWDH